MTKGWVALRYVVNDVMGHPLCQNERERYQRKHDLEDFGALVCPLQDSYATEMTAGNAGCEFARSHTS
jgi:hypothetical protein